MNPTVYGEAGQLHGHRRQRRAIGGAAHRLGHVFRRRDDARQCARSSWRGRYPCGHKLLPSAPTRSRGSLQRLIPTSLRGAPRRRLSQAVEQDGTTTAIVSSATSSVFGQSVTFTATVSPTTPRGGGAADQGQSRFIDGSTVLGSPILSGGVGDPYTTSSLSVSNHKVKAVCGGDSQLHRQRVVDRHAERYPRTPRPPRSRRRRTPRSSANPSPSGHGRRRGAGGGTPTEVRSPFKDGSSSLGTATLSSGSCKPRHPPALVWPPNRSPCRMAAACRASHRAPSTALSRGRQPGEHDDPRSFRRQIPRCLARP